MTAQDRTRRQMKLRLQYLRRIAERKVRQRDRKAIKIVLAIRRYEMNLWKLGEITSEDLRSGGACFPITIFSEAIREMERWRGK